MERAVLRGRGTKAKAIPSMIGIDEKAISKGHRCMTLVCDLQEAKVEYIGDERREASLGAYFAAFEAKEREALQAISLDMWPPYINACRRDVPEADQKMVFDRFHIMSHVVKAVDTVRKRKHKALLEAGDTTLTNSAENAPRGAGLEQQRRDRLCRQQHLVRVWQGAAVLEHHVETACQQLGAGIERGRDTAHASREHREAIERSLGEMGLCRN